jgi:hypothetical protein
MMVHTSQGGTWMRVLAIVVGATVGVAILVTAVVATTPNLQAQAPKLPEYHKVWEDNQLRTKKAKRLKANTPSPRPHRPTAKRPRQQ